MRELLHQDYVVADIEISIAVERDRYMKFSMLKPTFGIDGNQYYVLLGEDLQSGICGFGNTLNDAVEDWNRQFYKPLQ